MDKNTAYRIFEDFMESNRGLVNELKTYWMMTEEEVIAEILKLGARNEIAILDQMSIDRMQNERGE